MSGLELVIASGDLVNLTREHDGGTLRAAVLGLGVLGVITKITLDIQPTYLWRTRERFFTGRR